MIAHSSSIAREIQDLLSYVHRWFSSPTIQQRKRRATLTSPYVTTGVAIVGASVIAATPITPTPPEVEYHAVQLSAAAQQTAAALPDFGNYAQVFATAFQKWVDALGTYLTTNVPAGLEEALGQLAAGELSGDSGAMYTLLVTINGAIMGPGIHMQPVLSIPGDILDDLGLHNLAAAAHYLIGVGTVWPLLGAITGPVYGPLAAIGDSAQVIYDAVGAGDFTTAVTELLRMPIVTVDALFNGYSYYRGLLTQNLYGNKGLIPTLLTIIPRAIELALGIPQTPLALAQSTLSAADEVPAEISSYGQHERRVCHHRVLGDRPGTHDGHRSSRGHPRR